MRMPADRRSVIVVMIALAVSMAFAQQRSNAETSKLQPAEETPEMFPAGPHRDDTFYFCTACHNFKLTAAQSMNREQWDETLDWMTTKHNMPKLDGDDRKNILDYLATAFPVKTPAQQGGFKNPFLN